MSILDNFRDWKEFLGDRVEQAKQAGMESETLQNVAYQIGGYLAEQVDPKKRSGAFVEAALGRGRSAAAASFGIAHGEACSEPQ